MPATPVPIRGRNRMSDPAAEPVEPPFGEPASPVFGAPPAGPTPTPAGPAGRLAVVTGAAGGVGLTAVEIGKKLGARVIAVARGADKLSAATNAGADHLIDSDSADLKAELRALGGADVVYETIGGEQFTAALGAGWQEQEGAAFAVGR